jgi:hypothetical protein
VPVIGRKSTPLRSGVPLRQLLNAGTEVSLGDDVVPVEDESRLEAGKGHGDLLANPGPHQIAHGGPS